MCSFVRTVLGLDPNVPAATIGLAPALPDWCSFLEVSAVPLAGENVTIGASVEGTILVDGVPSAITIGPPGDHATGC
jgi:hypothetical protein